MGLSFSTRGPPPKLRAEVAAVLGIPADSGTVPARGRLATRITEKSRAWLAWLSSSPIPALIACMLAIAGVTTLSRFSLTEAHADAFVDMAAQTHRQQLAGRLPLEVRTTSPSELSTWFADKVPFRFRLPTYQQRNRDGQTYELTGGRLVDFKGAHAAYVAYHMRSQIISLVLTEVRHGTRGFHDFGEYI